MKLPVCLTLLLASPFLPVLRAAEVLQVEVSTGSYERMDTPVFLEVPESIRSSVLLEITASSEKAVPSQVEPAAPGAPARLHWILAGSTAAKKVRRFKATLLTEEAAGAAGPLTLSDAKGRGIEVKLSGRSVLQYNYGKVPPPNASDPPIQARSAYLHPLWSPAGQVLTMDYPRDHLHHRGVWFPWTKTEFEGRHPDFWNLGDGTGTVESEAVDRTYQGPVFAGFRARQRHLDLKAPGGPKAALVERWDVRVYAVGGEKQGYFIFDLDSRQECASPSPLKLDAYRYGGLGIRGSVEWEGDTVRFFTSEGKGRLNGEGSTARWFDMSGPVKGPWAGVAILGHPSNFRAPQALRLNPSEPFGNFVPIKTEPFAIEPGKPYVSRYRFYLHNGVLQADEAQRLWIDYAEPPEVKIIR